MPENHRLQSTHTPPPLVSLAHTRPHPHPLALLDLSTVAVDGKLILVGVPSDKIKVSAFSFVMRRKQICGSLIGGIEETQEMLDFCGLHNIVCDIEKISAKDINEAYEKTVKSQVKYRFVIDTATI
jgi:uncharacterized zinc-type alcohol dehydrogenase-like protein